MYRITWCVQSFIFTTWLLGFCFFPSYNRQHAVKLTITNKYNALVGIRFPVTTEPINRNFYTLQFELDLYGIIVTNQIFCTTRNLQPTPSNRSNLFRYEVYFVRVRLMRTVKYKNIVPTTVEIRVKLNNRSYGKSIKRYTCLRTESRKTIKR